MVDLQQPVARRVGLARGAWPSSGGVPPQSWEWSTDSAQPLWESGRRSYSRRVRLFRRKGPTCVAMDADGVRRLHGGRVVETVAWADLALVDVVTTDQGPAADDVIWLLCAHDGTGVAVPSEQAPDGFLERLQQLPGFDNEAVIQAMGSVTDARFRCWDVEAST